MSNATIISETAPCVCVIIAAYNAEGTIVRAVRSALEQPEVAEVIVVDDASTDNTPGYAKSADDGSKRLKVLMQRANGGPSAARNRAISESVSPWVSVLDADDFFLPGRMKALLAHGREADLIADDMWQVAENAVDGPRKSLMNPPLRAPRTIGFREFVLSNVTRPGRRRGELGFIKPIMRRDFLETHGIQYQEHMRLGEDFELYARALALGARLLVIPEPGYVSVVRPDSLSGRHSIADLRALRDCNSQLLNSLRLSPADRKALRLNYLGMDCRLQWRLLINAKKNKNLAAALATFLRPWPVPIYLFKQLALHVYSRGFPKKEHVAQ